MKKVFYLLTICAAFGWAGAARATPSTTVWAPSTTYIQPYLVPHVTYDTYFGKGPAPGALNSPAYPTTTGLTMGVLPWEKLNLEVGFDLMLPLNDPFMLNAKLGTPEGTFFAGSPSLAVGIYGVGTKSDVSNYNILYGQLQKSLPWGGFLSVGGYYGAGSPVLWTELADDGTPTGNLNRAGFIGGAASPDINIDIPGLKKIFLSADVQTGKNVFGAAGGAINFFFTDSIGILTGPVFFFDKGAQPGQRDFMWTIQADLDITLFKPAAAPAPPAEAPKT